MSTPAKRPQPRAQLSSMQIVFGSILAISMLLAINFSGRIAAGQRVEQEVNGLQSTIDSLQYKATALKSTQVFVESDAYPEQWARREGKMVKPGEKLVVPVPGKSAPQPTPTPFTAVVTETPPENQNWQLWWQLFFDSPPPEIEQQ